MSAIRELQLRMANEQTIPDGAWKCWDCNRKGYTDADQCPKPLPDGWLHCPDHACYLKLCPAHVQEKPRAWIAGIDPVVFERFVAENAGRAWGWYELQNLRGKSA